MSLLDEIKAEPVLTTYAVLGTIIVVSLFTGHFVVTVLALVGVAAVYLYTS